MRTVRILPFFLALLAIGSAHAQTAVQSILDTEAAFGKTAQEKSLRDGFLTYASDSAQIFSNGVWILAKPYWKTAPKPQFPLTWKADFVDASKEGDLGYTTGPWFINKGVNRFKQGQFSTVWVRQPSGTYLFRLDLGVEYDMNDRPIPDVAQTATIPSEPSSINRDGVLDMEENFAKNIRKNGAAQTYLEHLSDEARLVRPGHTPMIQKNRIESYLRKQKSHPFEARGVLVSKAGDLACVYGDLTGRGLQGTYIRIWKNEAQFGWKIVLEVFEGEAEQD